MEAPPRVKVLRKGRARLIWLVPKRQRQIVQAPYFRLGRTHCITVRRLRLAVYL